MKIKAIIIFIIILTIAFEVFSQNTKVSFPNSIAGKRANAFWKLINSKDSASLDNFIKNEMVTVKTSSVEERKTVLGQLRQILGGSKIVKIYPAKTDEISFIARNDVGEMGKIRLMLSKDKKYLISQIGLSEATEDDLSDKPEKILSETEFVSTVDGYLKDLTENDDFSGVVLVAKNGKSFYRKAFGYANVEFKVSNKIDTKFNTGSIDKTFTKLAIGMLIDEEKISLDDKLGKFLPNYPNKNAREKVTVKHLLKMTSGIGDIFNPKFFSGSKAQFRTLEDYLPVFASEKLQFEPGTKRRYSNGSYILLGIIIEKVTKQSYFDFVQDRIFKPIGMSNTYAFETDAAIPNRATGYTLNTVKDKSSKKRMTNALMIPVKGSSAGGGYSTAEDLLKFANAIENGTFNIPKASLKLDPGLKHGIGIAGGAPGLNAVLETKVADKYTVIVMSNYDPPIAEKVSKQIRRWIKNTK